MAANFLSPPDGSVSFNEGYLARLRNGDHETAKHFHAYFRRRLSIMLSRRFGRERMDELIGTTMLAAITNIMKGEPRDPSSLVGYVRGICTNLTRKEFAKLQKEAVTDINLDRLSIESKTAEDELLAQERAEAIRQVLRELSEKDRNVLVDLFYHETPREKVCMKYQVTGVQLRMILFHARMRFRKSWDEREQKEDKSSD